MADEVEYRCFIGGLSWSTDDRGLKDAFDKFGHLVEAKVSDLFFFFRDFFGVKLILIDNCFLCNAVLQFYFLF